MPIAVCRAGRLAKPAIESRTSDILGTPGSNEYATAKDIVDQASLLADAVQSNFFLGPLSQRDKDEIAHMLPLDPDDVAGRVLDALRTAFGAGARIVFVWNKHPTGGFDDTNATNDGVAFVELRTPPGSARP